MVRAFLFSLALAVGLGASAFGPAAAQGAPLFSDTSEVPLTIEGPINTIVRTAAQSTAVHPATLIAGEQRFNIELSARGLTRRTGGYCSFPPLRINFENNTLRGTLFQGQNHLKLVTRCRTGGENLVVLEYLIYRIYNELTPQSFNVRPVRVTYRDSEGRRREETQFGFLIEDVDDMAHRNHLVALDVQNGAVSSAGLDANAAARDGLFQYMIGNLDWDMTSGHPGDDCCHNGKLLAATAAARTNVVPVPYDFDYSGFVNAPYAVPPAQLTDVHNVLTRYYRGWCRNNDQIPAAIEVFRARRAAITALIAGETRLPEARRRTAQNYIDAFYAVLDDPRRVQSQITGHCRER
jgi:hypothetical protein